MLLRHSVACCSTAAGGPGRAAEALGTHAYQQKYSQRESIVAYRKQWEREHKEQRSRYKRELHAYQCGWGGDPRTQNCMLKIDPALFM